MPKDQRRHIVQRLPKRADYDRTTINSIIDEALICHVGLCDAGQPVVIPTIHARVGNQILLHGLKGGRLLKHVNSGHDVCITVTLLDGLVLARSAFHHSMNYRSVVIFGKGREVVDATEKMAAMQRFVDHLTPGRWEHVRQPNAKEFKVTSIVAVDMEDASAKVRAGPVSDEEEDYALPIWAGVVPLELMASPPVADDKLDPDIKTPEHVTGYQPATRKE